MMRMNMHLPLLMIEKQSMVLVSIGGVPNVSMIVDSGASCNVIDCQSWESLRQN